MRLRLRSRLRRMSLKGLILLGAGGVIVLAAIGGGVYAALGGVGAPQSSGDIELQRGLIGWWKLDGNTTDSTPYNYGGSPTVTGTTATTDRKNTTGKALSFNGSGDNVTYGSTTAYNPGLTDSRTFSVWFKAGSQAHAGYLLWQNGVCRGFYLGVNTSGYVYMALSTSANGCTSPTYYQATTSISYADNQWHMATGVVNRSAGTVTLYIDGVQRASASGVDTSNSAIGGNFIIGSDNTYTKTLAGSVDDARIYNRALNTAEITALAKSYDTVTNLASGEKGLLGWWKLDGNAKDATPYGNNGTINGTLASVADRKGATNKAFSFDGSTNYIDIPAGYNIGTTGLTYSAWVYPTAYSNSYNMIMGHHLPYLDIYNSGGTPKADLSLYANGAQRHVFGSTLLPVNHWYYIVGTYDTSGYMKVYVNGILDGTAGPYTPFSTTYNGSSYHQFIGQYNAGGTYKFTGTIDEVRIYNRDLSATEIAAQYASYNSQISLQASPTGSSSSGNINAGLIGYWPLNGNLRDATPYGNVGTGYSATTVTDRKGNASSAYSLDGATGHRIVLPSTGVYKTIANSSFTLSSWIKTTDTSGQVCILSSTGSSNGYRFGYSASKPYFLIGDGTHYVETTIGSTNLNNGAWHLLTVVYSYSSSWSVTGYLDGVNIGTVSAATVTSVPSAATNTTLGAMDTSGNFHVVNGAFDDVRMYNRALSATEISTLYNRP